MAVVASSTALDEVEYLGKFKGVGVIANEKISTDHAHNTIVKAGLGIERFHGVAYLTETLELCHNLLSA